jgi:hypothetical protein
MRGVGSVAFGFAFFTAVLPSTNTQCTRMEVNLVPAKKKSAKKKKK